MGMVRFKGIGDLEIPFDNVPKTTVVNRRKQEEDVYIGRGSIWGNPYTHLPIAGTQAAFQVSTRKEALDKYLEYILQRPDLLAKLDELRGKRLGCYCVPKPCHGDILVRLIGALDLMKKVYKVEIDFTKAQPLADIKQLLTSKFIQSEKQ